MSDAPGTGELLFLSDADVRAVDLPMADIIRELERMFAAKGRGEVEMPPKPGIHPSGDAFIHAMPAYVRDAGAAGMKWVSGYPQNPAIGLPYIHGVIVMNDPATGIPTAILDCRWITAMRTGAATAVAAKHLARPESRSVGIIACGVQGRSNLEALCCGFDVREVRAYDIDPRVARRFADEMGARLDLDISVVDSPRDAVSGCAMVVTSGPILKDPSPVVEAGWLDEGAFASLVDFDSYFTGAALAEADLIATDDHAQLRYYRSAGYFRATPEPYADLGEIVCGAAVGRESSGQRTISINLGLALEDVVTAMPILAAARDRGIGQTLRL